MKKIILGILMVTLVVPSVTFANNFGDLESKKLDLMKQLITLLEIRVQQLQLLLAEINGVSPQVLGIATSTPNVSAAVEEVKEKKRRRGGGGSSKSNNDPVVENPVSETETATTTPEIEDTATSTTSSTDDSTESETEEDTNKKLVLSTTTVTTKSDTSGSDNEIGVFEIGFTLTAEEEDFYINNFISNNASGTSRGIAYSITGPEGAEISSYNLFAPEDASIEITEDVFKIEKGTSERFHLTVMFGTDTTGQYQVALEEINYTKIPDGVSNIRTIIPTAKSLFRTSHQFVNESDISNPDEEATDDDIVTEDVDSFLKLGLSNNNPDSFVVYVEDLVDTDDNHLLSFNLESEDGSFDVSQLAVGIETKGGNVGQIVDEVNLVIDGVTYHAEPFVSEGSENINDEKAVYVFNVEDLNLLEEDEEFEVDVLVDINESENNFDSGQKIQAVIAEQEKSAWVVKEGEDFVSQDELIGEVLGDVHTLVSKGIIIPVDSVETSTNTSGDNDTLGEFTIEFDVTAIEGDFYIAETATLGTSATIGVEFSYTGSNASSTGDVVSGTLSSTADEDTPGVFMVSEGETETFTLSVTIDPAFSGDYRVALTGVNYTSDASGVVLTKLFEPTPVQDFRTSYETIQGS